MSNTKKYSTTPKIGPSRPGEIKFDLIMAAIAAVLLIGALQTHRIRTQDAYDKMYSELETKSPDYRTSLDFYRYCTAHLQPSSVTSQSCMDETESWAKKQPFTTPFETIARDIREGEARAYLDSRS